MPTAAEAIGLIASYSGASGSLWNLYIGVITLVIGTATVKQGRVIGGYLIFAYVLFTLVNASALLRNYAVQNALWNYAKQATPKDGVIADVIVSLKPATVAQMLTFHVAVDVLVIVAIILISTKFKGWAKPLPKES